VYEKKTLIISIFLFPYEWRSNGTRVRRHTIQLCVNRKLSSVQTFQLHFSFELEVVESDDTALSTVDSTSTGLGCETRPQKELRGLKSWQLIY
jgi:hypothetical protein